VHGRTVMCMLCVCVCLCRWKNNELIKTRVESRRDEERKKRERIKWKSREEEEVERPNRLMEKGCLSTSSPAVVIENKVRSLLIKKKEGKARGRQAYRASRRVDIACDDYGPNLPKFLVLFFRSSKE